MSLSYAASNGFTVVVTQLLEDDTADVNLPDQFGRTPLSWAAGNGHKAVVKELLNHGQADLTSTDLEYGKTPLLWARLLTSQFTSVCRLHIMGSTIRH